MKTYTILPLTLVFILFAFLQNIGNAQVPTCDDYAPTSTQQWELNPTLDHVFLDEFNSHTAWYKFPIVRNRQYFRFVDIDDQGNLPVIFYQIYQLGLGDDCSELELIYSGSLGNIDDEIYAEPFEVGNYSGYIKFSSFEDINLKFAVMYGDPANGTENSINVQDYEDTDYENSSTLALPEDPNVNGVVAWYNFSVSSMGAYFLNASSPIPTYPGIVALHRSDYSIVNMGASDYYNPNCLTPYFLIPGNNKIKVMSFVNSAPGFAHISLHEPPSNTAPNDRMVNATDLAPATYGNHTFIHATIQHASVSPQVTLCTNEYSGQQQLGRDIWYQFTATQSSYYFIIKNIEDIEGNLGQIKISVLTEDGQSTIGSSCEQFFPMGANEAVKVIEGLTPGNLYKLRLVGFNNNFVCEPFHTEFDFCLARPDCISNDDCANSSAFAAPQPGQDATLSGTTYCAELLASGDCNTSVEKSAWWSFTATQAGYDFTLTAFDDVFNGGFNGVDLEITSDCNGATVPGTCKTILLNQTKSIGGLTIGQTYSLRIRTGLNDASFSLLVHAPELDETDDCSSTAILPVSSACNFTNISTENATQSPEGTCGSGNNDDVWYNFTASSPIIRFDVDNIVAVQGSVTAIYFGIYESCNGALVACFALNESLDHEVSNLTLGQTYKLQLFTFGEDNRGTFDVCLESITTVPNDDCANATAVSPQIYNTPNPTPIAVNTMGASSGVNDCDDNPVDDDLWYSFTASSTSYLFKHSNFVTTSGFPGSTVVKVEFFETCGGASVGCYYLLENVARVVVLTQGQSYRYRIWTEESSISATFDLLQLQLPNTPANDYCDDPVHLTVSPINDPCTPVAGSTLGGTYSLDFECGFAWYDDVYFSFTADYSSVALTLDNFTQLWGTSTGLRVQLFGDCLFDYNWVCHQISEGGTVLFGNLNIGQTYYLKIFSADCVECYTSFDLCLKEGGPPNDVPNLNFEYNMNNGSPISGTTVNASYDAAFGLPVCVPPGTPIQDVWYFLENYDHINGEVTISNAGNEIKAALYKGDINTPANLTIIPSTCGSGSRSITLNGLEQGQLYWLRVWSENSNTGNFEVSYLDLTAATATVAAPAPNICSPTTSVTVDGSNANNVGIPVMMGDDLVLIIYPSGNDLGQVTVHFYVSSTPRTDDQNIPYLKRNMAIIPQFQPTPGNPVTLRFLMTTAEFNAFAVSLPDFKVTRVNDQPCAGAVAGSGNTLLSQPYAWANGSLLDGYYFDVQTDHFSSFYAHGGNIALQGAALPVELIDFRGKIQGSNAVMLTWRTGSEQDNLGFFVEKSTDGKWFEAIGFVPGAGTGLEEHAYSFFDENFRASAYYRLRQLDMDGREVFSPIVFLEKETEPDLRFFPIPAGSNVTFSIHEPSDKTTLVFYDWKGSIVYENAFPAGQTSLVLDVKNWKSGIYVVKLTLDSKTIIKRLVVSR